MECTKKAATAIKRITYAGDDDNNEGIAKMIAICGWFKGIETLLLASNEYTGGDDIAQLEAILDIWKAFVHITYLDYDKIWYNYKCDGKIDDESRTI